MTEHQFSARFKKATDQDYKFDEFQKNLAKYFAGFIECYPHLIEKVNFDSENETWIFKFSIEVPCDHEIVPVHTVTYNGKTYDSEAICNKCGDKP